MNLVFGAEGLSVGEGAFLMACCNHTDARGYVIASMQQLADEAHMTTRAARDNKQRLIRRGLLKTAERFHPKNGAQIADLYRVNLDLLKEMQRKRTDYGPTLVEELTFDAPQKTAGHSPPEESAGGAADSSGGEEESAGGGEEESAPLLLPSSSPSSLSRVRPVTPAPTVSAEAATDERETDQDPHHTPPHAAAGPAAAEVRSEHPFPEQKAGGKTVARVVAAWTEARAKHGHGVPVAGEKGLARDVTRLLADGVDVEDLVAAAADMGRRANWLSLPQHLLHYVPAARKPEPRRIEGRCPRHPDFPEDACVICVTLERRREQRDASEPQTIGGASLLARLRAGQPT